jgi:hypothetical protein
MFVSHWTSWSGSHLSLNSKVSYLRVQGITSFLQALCVGGRGLEIMAAEPRRGK